jgi:glycosyltransferase involved in cell wall biosynthesis
MPDREHHVCSIDVEVLLADPRYAPEGCSSSVIEYMTFGLPCVAGQGGGNAELVEEEAMAPTVAARAGARPGATGWMVGGKDHGL